MTTPPEAETDRAAAERIAPCTCGDRSCMYDYEHSATCHAIVQPALASALATVRAESRADVLAYADAAKMWRETCEESRAEIEKLKVRLAMADTMATQKSEQYIAERRAHQATSGALAKARAALDRYADEANWLRTGHGFDPDRYWIGSAESGWNIARNALASLSEASPSTCFECGAPLIVMGPVCPICNPGLALASPSLRDVTLEEAAKIAERFFGGPAHTYASENADVYRAQDNACRRIAEAIRALLANPKTAGEGK